MTQGWSLLGFIVNLVEDPAARQQFEADPEHVLRAHGFDELSAHDVVDALPLVADTVQASYESSAPAAPPPSPQPQPGETHLAAAVRHISHITATYGHDAGVSAADKNIWLDGDVHDSFDTAGPHDAATAAVTGFGSGASAHLGTYAFGTGHTAAPAGEAGLAMSHGPEISYAAPDLSSDIDHGAVDVPAHAVLDTDHPVDHADWFDGPHS